MPSLRARTGSRPSALLSVLLSLVAAVGLSLAGTGTAQAATDRNGTCETGEFCVYAGKGQTYEKLDMYWERSDFSVLSWPIYGGSPNDKNQSYWNLDNLTWHVYTDANRGGQHGWIGAGVASDASSDFYRKVSSAYYTT